jgi:hypothetical protein
MADAEAAPVNGFELKWESTPRLLANGKGLESILADIFASLGKIPPSKAQENASEDPKWFSQVIEQLKTHGQMIDGMGNDSFRIQALEDAVITSESAVSQMEDQLKKIASQQLSSEDLISRTAEIIGTNLASNFERQIQAMESNFEQRLQNLESGGALNAQLQVPSGGNETSVPAPTPPAPVQALEQAAEPAAEPAAEEISMSDSADGDQNEKMVEAPGGAAEGDVPASKWKQMKKAGHGKWKKMVDAEQMKELQMMSRVEELIKIRLENVMEEWGDMKLQSRTMEKTVDRMENTVIQLRQKHQLHDEINEAKNEHLSQNFKSQMTSMRMEMGNLISLDDWNKAQAFNKSSLDNVAKGVETKIVQQTHELERRIENGLQTISNAQSRALSGFLKLSEDLSGQMGTIQEDFADYKETNDEQLVQLSSGARDAKTTLTHHSEKITLTTTRLDQQQQALAQHAHQLEESEKHFNESLEKLESHMGDDLRDKLAQMETSMNGLDELKNLVTGDLMEKVNAMLAVHDGQLLDTNTKIEQLLKWKADMVSKVAVNTASVEELKKLTKGGKEIMASLSAQCSSIVNSLNAQKEITNGKLKEHDNQLAGLNEQCKALKTDGLAIKKNCETKLDQLDTSMRDFQEKISASNEHLVVAVRAMDERLDENLHVIAQAAERSKANASDIAANKQSVEEMVMKLAVQTEAGFVELQATVKEEIEGRIAWCTAEIGKVEKRMVDKMIELKIYTKTNCPYNRLKERELNWQLDEVTRSISEEYLVYEKDSSSTDDEGNSNFRKAKEALNDSCCTSAQRLAELIVQKAESPMITTMLMGEELNPDVHSEGGPSRPTKETMQRFLEQMTRLLRGALAKATEEESASSKSKPVVRGASRDRWVARMRQATEFAMLKYMNSQASGGDILLSRKKLTPVCMGCNRAFDKGHVEDGTAIASHNGNMGQGGGPESSNRRQQQPIGGGQAADGQYVVRGGFKMKKKGRSANKQRTKEEGRSFELHNEYKAGISASASEPMMSAVKEVDMDMTVDVKLPNIEEHTIRTTSRLPNR